MWRHVAWLEWWQWFERKTSEPLIHSPKLWKAQAKEPIKSSDLLVFELGRQKPREHTRYLSHWEHFYSLDLVNQMTWFKPLFYTIFFFKRICISYCSRKIEMHFSWIVIIPVLIVEQPQEEEHECTVYMCNSYMLVSQCIYMPFKLSRVNPVVIALATISFYLWLSLILYSSLGFIYNVWGFFWNF